MLSTEVQFSKQNNIILIFVLLKMENKKDIQIKFITKFKFKTYY